MSLVSFKTTTLLCSFRWVYDTKFETWIKLFIKIFFKILYLLSVTLFLTKSDCLAIYMHFKAL